MAEIGETPPSIGPRQHGLQLLVVRTAGAVCGALAGGAVALGIGMTAMPTTALGVVGALLGAIAATGASRP